ncbi:metallophosphoesterase [Dendrosporobacter sp. 1207_IL3150]|uniref:metallophosphoesterase n=1 Tax=Dendrosporobacter sp. 1207_IL3150 TaxID=3084054 RepID=UPI002FD90CAE
MKTAFVSIFLAFYGAINYYIGLRTWDSLGHFFPFSNTVFWSLLFVLAMSYYINKAWASRFPEKPIHLLALIGSYWLAITYFAFFFWLLADFLTVINYWLIWVPAHISSHFITGFAVWIGVFLLLFYGTWNATHPITSRYNIKIDKSAGNLSRLHAVFVSDIHLGPLVGTDRLRKLVQSINSLDPDIVFLGGDIIDENVVFFANNHMPEILGQIKSKFGVYAILGNHEYIGGQGEQAVEFLTKANATVLRDNYIKIADSFILAGRDDRSSPYFNKVNRATAAKLFEGVDSSLPIILLDHQPSNLDEAKEQGVDLQLSGHTHRGQFFPNNLITKSVFEIDWGYLKKGNLNVIVSSGYATWGPPIRIGTKPELVDILIEFKT